MLRAVLVLALAVPVLAQPQGYTIVVVGPCSSPPVINNAGQVAGIGPAGAFWWDPSTGTGHLVWVGGGTTVPTGINSQGYITGRVTTSTGPRAFMWHRKLDQWHLGYLGSPGPGLGWSQARAVNDDGFVVGMSSDWTRGGNRAFIWHQALGMLDLEAIIGVPSTSNAQVGAISKHWIAFGDFIWNPVLGRSPPIPGSIFDVNDYGQVAGAANRPGMSPHAHFWHPLAGVTRDLGTLPGDQTSIAYAINKQGTVVGVSEDATGRRRAFLWENGTMVDINALRPPGTAGLREASDINDSGWIVGRDLQYGGFAVLFIPR